MRTAVLAFLLGVLSAVGAAEPVAAECNPSGADVSFIATAPYAKRIVIGRVVDAGPDPDGQGPAQDGVTFTLEVQEVLRGPSIAELKIDHLETRGCIRWLSAESGDVIALAFDTRGDHPTLASATAAWLEGQPRISDPYEVLTRAEVLKAVAQRPPDTSTAPDERAPRAVSPSAIAMAMIGTLSLLLVTCRELGRAGRRAGTPRRWR